MTKIKLCGLRAAEDIAAVNEAAPDYAGFILSPRFWRYVPPEQVKQLRLALLGGIETVGVIVDEPLEYASALLNEGVVDSLQLHGSETSEYISALRALATGHALCKALRIKGRKDLAAARACTADRLLLDSGTGSGQSFDWSLTAGFDRPFILAGGLNAQNVAAAIAQVHPWGVDVSSGIETDKRKDARKIQAFVNAVRAAE